MARKTKYTPELVQRICGALEFGATHEIACGYAGIVPSTFYEWLKKKPEFSEAVKGAEARAAVKWLAKIEQAATTHWQAAAWKLERRYPSQYGRTVQDINQKVDIDIHAVSRRVAEELGVPAVEVLKFAEEIARTSKP